ncbi:unnamed protein product [Durusdinium trenchii]|uniref:Uncharacterized protein n=2 Tax=Durusdinium trenchii TaxID=1381693 RepID=A0ABP0KDU9_9DINO
MVNFHAKRHVRCYQLWLFTCGMSCCRLYFAATTTFLGLHGVGRGINDKPSRSEKTAMEAADPRLTLPKGAMIDTTSSMSQIPIPQAIVLLLCAAIPVGYWWFVIVPFKRREVASSKKRGPLKVYLQDLAATPSDERKQEKWFYDKYLRQGKFLEAKSEGLTDVVEKVEDQLQEKLPGGGFWSFDNPILVCLVALSCFCVQQILLHDVLNT